MGATVDIDFLTGNVGRLFRCEEHDGVSNLLSLTRPAHRNSSDYGVSLLLRHAFPDLGVDQAGAYTVSGNTVL